MKRYLFALAAIAAFAVAGAPAFAAPLALGHAAGHGAITAVKATHKHHHHKPAKHHKAKKAAKTA